MSGTRFKLTDLELLEFAHTGVTTDIGINCGNPNWTREDWEFHFRAQREIERRIKIIKTREAKNAQEEN